MNDIRQLQLERNAALDAEEMARGEIDSLLDEVQRLEKENASLKEQLEVANVFVTLSKTLET